MDESSTTGSPQEPFTPRQTNTGLYAQLQRGGVAPAEIAAVQSAYRVALRLFAGRHRKTERAFICHAVGAASSMAHFDGRPPLVIAALLHAAYDVGLFPDGRLGGRTRRHRKWLERRVGSEVESLLYRYQDFSFEAGDPERCLEQGHAPGDEDLLLIALAHEVDDLADFGLRFAAKYGAALDSRLEACAELAGRIGRPALAKTFRLYAPLYRDCDWVDEFSSRTMRGFQVVPGLLGYLRYRFNHLRGKPVVLQ